MSEISFVSQFINTLYNFHTNRINVMTSTLGDHSSETAIRTAYLRIDGDLHRSVLRLMGPPQLNDGDMSADKNSLGSKCGAVVATNIPCKCTGCYFCIPRSPEYNRDYGQAKRVDMYGTLLHSLCKLCMHYHNYCRGSTDNMYLQSGLKDVLASVAKVYNAKAENGTKTFATKRTEMCIIMRYEWAKVVSAALAVAISQLVAEARNIISLVNASELIETMPSSPFHMRYAMDVLCTTLQNLRQRYTRPYLMRLRSLCLKVAAGSTLCKCHGCYSCYSKKPDSKIERPKCKYSIHKASAVNGIYCSDCIAGQEYRYVGTAAVVHSVIVVQNILFHAVFDSVKEFTVNPDQTFQDFGVHLSKLFLYKWAQAESRALLTAQ
jgi:hypothetical protein